MSALAPLLGRPGCWLASPGEHDGIVVSSRVRLARNLADQRFFRKMPRSRQQALVEDLLAVLVRVADGPNGWSLRTAALSEAERLALVERQLVSRDLAGSKRPGGLWLAADEGLAAMVNEEDHLRLQAIRPGLRLADCLAAVVDLDHRLENELAFAFDPRLGYLTACHSNLGTGMRASVMLHLPALAETGEIKSVLHALGRLHLTVRGRHGEGSEPTGNLFQISNLRSLGMDEEGLVKLLGEAVERIVAAERLAREQLLVRARRRLEDKIFRAWGLLTHARSLTCEELLCELGWLRLGLALRILGGPDWSVLDRLLLRCQPAHLILDHPDQVLTGAAERDLLRADLVRRALLN